MKPKKPTLKAIQDQILASPPPLTTKGLTHVAALLKSGGFADRRKRLLERAETRGVAAALAPSFLTVLLGQNFNRFRDITGQRFGDLTAEAHVACRISGRHHLWRCRCKCGRTVLRVKGYLLNPKFGHRCRHRTIEGKRFGRLTARYHAACAYPQRTEIWAFDCDCGKRVLRSKGGVKQASKASCGCDRPAHRVRTIRKGKRFGKLTARYVAAQYISSRQDLWYFSCDCGGSKLRTPHSVKNSKYPCCGCTTRRRRPMPISRGDRFGKLTARHVAAHYIVSRQKIWRFSCDCGGSVLRPLYSVINAARPSCGCARNARNRGRIKGSRRINVAGMRFGRLYARRLFEIREGRPWWVFDCACGNHGVVRALFEVRRQEFPSCGCRLLERRERRQDEVKSRKTEKNGLFRQLDITGLAFGDLTAERMISKDRHQHAIWRFACVCGGSVERPAAYVKQLIRTNIVPSCGCRFTKRKHEQMDLTGLRSGALVAERPDTEWKGKKRKWLCRCEACGHSGISVFGWKLRGNDVNSCDRCRRSGFRISDHPRLIRASKRSYREVYAHNAAMHQTAHAHGASPGGAP